MDNRDEYLLKFKEHLAALNRSALTIASYQLHLKAFLNNVKEGDMRKVTRATIEEYIAGLGLRKTVRGGSYSTSTLCAKVRAIKRFFEFLEKMNIVFIDPAETIKEPPKDKNLVRKILSRQETLRVLDQPNLGTRLGIRDRSILEVFDSTGIRVQEICRLTIYDADLTGGLLRINEGKGKKDRVVPLGKHAIRFLKEYIAKIRPHYTRKNRSERCLFVDRYGKAIQKQAVSVMVRKYGQDARIGRPISPHIFRHGFATTLIRNGADILAVQKMMGHEDPRTTQVYIRSLGLEVKKVHQKTHPREKDKIDPQTIKPHIERMMPKYDTE